jgi:leader peptidase (prepilin peptidase)/N-methyltransferase
MEWLVVALAFVAGAAIGSFLNVVISRVPKHESIVRPASHCPSCNTPIAPRDNIPIVSWLVLRGRCRTCGWRIPVRYWLVEVACGLLFAVVALVLVT